MAVLIDTAELSGLAIEGVLYGIFVSLFCVCGYDLVSHQAQRRRRLGWPMVTAGVLLILLATARFAVDCAYVSVAFIHRDPRAARLAYLQDVKVPLYTTKHCLFIADLLVGDSFVNYRCWVVWGKKIWVVALPILLSLVSAVSGSYTMWAFSNRPDQQVQSEATWLTVFFSLSLVANAMATCKSLSAYRDFRMTKCAAAALLAFRIWSIDRRLKNALESEVDNSRLTPIVRIILESGLINAAYLFVMVVTLEAKSEALELMSEMAVPLTGIIFSIVILRVGLQRHDDTFYTTQQPTTIISWAGMKRTTRMGGEPTSTVTALSGGGTPMLPLEVIVHGNDTGHSAKVQDEADSQRDDEGSES
ncbi:hypothetical protein C8Q79DRAFT_118161 [Trametes meyenii]|nr:hypothetical protein C8Q79DRAFT_118161 [Trametes meyenii]